MCVYIYRLESWGIMNTGKCNLSPECGQRSERPKVCENQIASYV